MRGFNRETVLMGSKLNEGYIHACTQFTGCELRIKVNIIKVFKKKKSIYVETTLKIWRVYI